MSTPKAATYEVTGVAFIPVKISIHVEAASEAEAKEKSREVFKREKSRCIVAGTEDESCVFDFDPSEATKLP